MNSGGTLCVKCACIGSEGERTSFVFSFDCNARHQLSVQVKLLEIKIEEILEQSDDALLFNQEIT